MRVPGGEADVGEKVASRSRPGTERSSEHDHDANAPRSDNLVFNSADAGRRQGAQPVMVMPDRRPLPTWHWPLR
jgi:hypothetical protein